MYIPSFRPSRPFLYSLLVISLFTSKGLHLLQFATSVPILEFAVFFPTFFISDVLVAILGWVLLHGVGNGIWPVIGLSLGSSLSVIVFFAASSQLGFYYVTGTEMQWDNAGNVASDPAAVRIMLSGLFQVSVSGMGIYILSWLSTPFLYNKAGQGVFAVWGLFTGPKWEMLLPTVRDARDQTQKGSFRARPLWLAAFTTLILLRLIRPSTPYGFMSRTLPVAMFRMFSHPHRGPYRDLPECLFGNSHIDTFPLSNLTLPKYWERPKGYYKGWAPKGSSSMVRGYRNRRPEWATHPLPDGFHRWANISQRVDINNPSDTDLCFRENNGSYFYNPAADPLRITNLNIGIHQRIQEALKDENFIISHIVLITMESARKDLFPIREGSFLHQTIVNSSSQEEQEAKNNLLSQLTPVAHQITGEGFRKQKDSDQSAFEIPDGVWKDSAAAGMGGINILGAMTGSTLSAKSFLSSHCGVYPLPVDFLQEVTTHIYQPCIPHIFNLFNEAKDRLFQNAVGTKMASTSGESVSLKKRKWKSIFVQASTDSYDRQDKSNTQIGFASSVVRESMANPSSKHYPPKSAVLNYFGYPDEEVRPYIHDAITDAIDNNERLFLSHFTSTTHHPWKLPADFELKAYTGQGGKGDHDDLNRFLNTVRYDDAWLGQILGILEEKGIANETLVVVVGDHGQAFEEDAPVHGTYRNGHISNFRVPIVFRHPQLPRLNIEVNATSMSILPTILDLLVNSKSLDDYDASIAQDLINDYQGQSLIRPYRSQYKGRRSWNIAIINAGGKMISVSSAATPWRAVIPLDEESQYSFSDLNTDPDEVNSLSAWKITSLFPAVKAKHGEEAKQWLQDADEVAHWWVKEMHHLWNYDERVNPRRV